MCSGGREKIFDKSEFQYYVNIERRALIIRVNYLKILSGLRMTLRESEKNFSFFSALLVRQLASSASFSSVNEEIFFPFLVSPRHSSPNKKKRFFTLSQVSNYLPDGRSNKFMRFIIREAETAISRA